MNEMPATRPVIMVDDEATGLIEPNPAMVSPELIARVRASLRAMQMIQTTRWSRPDGA